MGIEQPCWNCKRCANTKEYPCKWIGEGKPIEGWTATKGKEYFHTNPNSGKKYSIGRTYEISSCPLYIRDKQFMDRSDYFKYIAQTLSVSETKVRANEKKYFDMYEEITGEKLPRFVTWYKTDKRRGLITE